MLSPTAGLRIVLTCLENRRRNFCWYLYCMYRQHLGDICTNFLLCTGLMLLYYISSSVLRNLNRSYLNRWTPFDPSVRLFVRLSVGWSGCLSHLILLHNLYFKEWLNKEYILTICSTKNGKAASADKLPVSFILSCVLGVETTLFFVFTSGAMAFGSVPSSVLEYHLAPVQTGSDGFK